MAWLYWSAVCAKKEARREAGLRVACGREREHTPVTLFYCSTAYYQVKRGPTNHSRSPALASFTSPLRPQFGVNLAVAPTRP